MAFVFALESVLRLRVGRERQEQARLEIMAQRLRVAQVHCDSVHHERADFEQKIQASMEAGMPSAEFYLCLQSRQGLKRAEEEAEHSFTEAKKQWSDQRVKFLDARREREVISSVRERQLADYLLLQARREQQRIDDLFAMRRLRQNG